MNDLTTNEWRDKLQAGQRRSVESVLEFGKLMSEYKQSCEVAQGGSVFSRNVKEWLGMSKPVASRWTTIGSRLEEFRCRNCLPPSLEALIAYLDCDEETRDKFTASTTVAKARAYREESKHIVRMYRNELDSIREEGGEEKTEAEKARVEARRAEIEKRKKEYEEQNPWTEKKQLEYDLELARRTIISKLYEYDTDGLQKVMDFMNE